MQNLKQSGKFFHQRWLTVPFLGAPGVQKNYSQCAQDLFVMSCMDGKKNGTFIELGCNEPYHINNTYFLESKFDWTGISIDFDTRFEPMWKSSTRTAQMSTQDATTLDWNKIGSTLGTTHIDYMSLDLEPAAITLKALQNIPLDKITFSVITYEHDEYRFGSEYKDQSRNILKQAGYVLLCADVEKFEDWWVNPKYVDVTKVAVLSSGSVSNGERHVMKNKPA